MRPVFIFSCMVIIVTVSCVMFEPDDSVFMSIAFITEVEGNTEVFIMNDNGSKRTQITFSDHYETAVDWSPDGTELAYVSKRMSNHYGDSLYCTVNICNSDGTEHKTIFNTYGVINGDIDDLKWSPDGGKILLYMSYYKPGLYVINSDGSDFTMIHDFESQIQGATWSPDSQNILFASDMNKDYNGDYSLYTIRPNGTGLSTIAVPEYRPDSPAYSADGSMITYLVDKEALAGLDIYMANADGTGSGIVVDEPGINRYVQFLHDNSGFIFINSVTLSNSDFYLYDMGSRTYKRLTDNFNHIVSYDISSNNRFIIFKSGRDIYRYNISQNSWTQLTDEDSGCYSPSVNPAW